MLPTYIPHQGFSWPFLLAWIYGPSHSESTALCNCSSQFPNIIKQNMKYTTMHSKVITAYITPYLSVNVQCMQKYEAIKVRQ